MKGRSEMNTNPRYITLTAVMVVLLLVGCQSGNQNPPAEDAANAGANGGSKERSSAGKEGKPATVTIPAGTEVSIRLVSAIDTGTACRVQLGWDSCGASDCSRQ